MPTEEIPRTEWNNFFDGLSRQHKGWLATLEVFAPEIGAQEQLLLGVREGDPAIAQLDHVAQLGKADGELALELETALALGTGAGDEAEEGERADRGKQPHSGNPPGTGCRTGTITG